MKDYAGGFGSNLASPDTLPTTSAGIAALGIVGGAAGAGLATTPASVLGGPFKAVGQAVGKFFKGKMGGGGRAPGKNKYYDREEIETKSGKAVRAKDATDDWDDFLGPDQTSIDPRTGKPSTDRIWSSDGERSIRYGDHEMNSNPRKHHYHKETWHDSHVDNVLQRVQE